MIVAVTPALPPLFVHADPHRVERTPGQAIAQTASACAGERLDLKIKLDEIFAAQRRDGALEFSGDDSLLYFHPLVASLSLDVYRQTGDTAFLERARKAVSSYFNYLLVHHDTDGDFLIERSAYRYVPGHITTGIEDVGFNSLLALDMLSLSKICIELKTPVDALFWYQGMKTISAEIISSTYDNAAGFFLPTSTTQTGRLGVYLALSVLPTYFHRELGDNISRSVLRNHLLTERPSPYEVPAHYLSWEFDDKELAATNPDERALRSILLFGALEWNGLDADAEWGAANHGTASDAGGGTFTRYFECAFKEAASRSLVPRNVELDLLETLVFQKALLDGPQTAQLRNGIATVREFVAGGGTLPPAPDRAGDAELRIVEQSIRDVYFSISALHDKWRDRTLYPPRVRDKLPGFDIYGATSRLWNDVIETLHDAENLIARTKTRSSGFEVTATLQSEATAPGVPVKLKCGLSTMASPVDVRSVVMFRDQTVDTLMRTDRPLHIEPGTPPHELAYALPVPRANAAAVYPLRFAVEVQLAGGERYRFYFRRGVCFTAPMSFAVTFPRGTVLSGGSVPVRIQVDKHTPEGAVIHAQWFSPAGLQPREGRAVESWMPENLERTSIDMNILVPAPCRPGAFPFVLKLFANGVDAGTVESSFFKHYQWLFVGPFPAKINALDSPYPPEAHVNLLATYAGAERQISWTALPAAAYADRGDVLLADLLPEGSVGFLYTVIHSGAERAVTTLFRSQAPAVLYLNGDEIIRVRGGAKSSAERAGVVLNEGMNNVLIKVLSHGVPTVYFQLGDEQDLTSDEFSNNLWELVDGYKELEGRLGGSPVEPAESQRRVTLTYHDPEANSVAVVGNFNGWSPANSSMRKNKYGDWEINLYLAPGRYAYRLLINNSDEILDPNSSAQEPDGYGSRNSVLFVQ